VAGHQPSKLCRIGRSPQRFTYARFRARESRCQRAYRTRVTFRLVLPCRKTRLATYMKPEKALFLEVDDIGRRGFSRSRALAGSCR
jgi:hypothetical protein